MYFGFILLVLLRLINHVDREKLIFCCLIIWTLSPCFVNTVHARTSTTVMN